MSLTFLSGPITKTLRTVWLSAGVRDLASPEVLGRQHPVQLGHVEVGVADDRVVGPGALGLLDVVGPPLVVAGGVDRQADDLHVALVELGLELGHVAELGRAHRGEVLGVGEQHGPRVADPVGARVVLGGASRPPGTRMTSAPGVQTASGSESKPLAAARRGLGLAGSLPGRVTPLPRRARIEAPRRRASQPGAGGSRAGRSSSAPAAAALREDLQRPDRIQLVDTVIDHDVVHRCIVADLPATF